jgi:adenylosuccinate lyase
MTHEIYQSPLSGRYSSIEMQKIFSDDFKYSTWRRLWLTLAEAQQLLGLPISNEQLQELTDHVDTINYTAAEDYEKSFEHDVMAHIHAYGDQCPKARGIIHLGATSCYVTDNTDLIQMQKAFQILSSKLKKGLEQLAQFARQYAELPCLGYTHFQPAQLTTVGKRACLWIQDLLLDDQELQRRCKQLFFLGTKGATGTQASFLSLFDGDHEKVKALDACIAKKMGFDNLCLISGQTYTRKQDMLVLNSLAGLGASAHKFATDLRLLAHLGEIEEPFKKKQVGSTAMPYKRNPILAERICSLSRYLISLSENSSYTFATQWLERSLDDSANRRLCLPEAFLTADAILELLLKITAGLKVYPETIQRHVEQELPLIAAENILMTSVKKGGDRQVLHEKLRVLSQSARASGNVSLFLEQIAGDPAFQLSREDLTHILDPALFVGRAPVQVEEFLSIWNPNSSLEDLSLVGDYAVQ